MGVGKGLTEILLRAFLHAGLLRVASASAEITLPVS